MRHLSDDALEAFHDAGSACDTDPRGCPGYDERGMRLQDSERTPTGASKSAPLRPSSDDGRVTALAVAPPLGAASSFGVVGASTVTNTGPTIVNGDLGLSPGTAVVGFPPGVGARNDTSGQRGPPWRPRIPSPQHYNALAGQACDVNLTGTDLGGLTAHAGRLLLLVVGPVDGHAHPQRARQPRFRLGLPDREARSRPRAIRVSPSSTAASRAARSGRSAAPRRSGPPLRSPGNILALASITLNTGGHQ